MKRCLITTTIRNGRNLRDWVDAGLGHDDHVIVAVDHRTPMDVLNETLWSLPRVTTHVIGHSGRWRCSNVIGWNSVQRRNVALLEAIALRPDYIVTVDDDNWPYDRAFFDHLDTIMADRGSTSVTIKSMTGWYNAGLLLVPQVAVRGLPVSHRHVGEVSIARHEGRPLRTGVFAALWLGDPDVDAIERIALRPRVDAMLAPQNVALAPSTWCPFNSQATAYLWELAPLMCVWPGVGRYDDIWSSYVAQRVMQELGYVVEFGRPLVRQDRNPHDPIDDLAAELLGLRYTEELCATLRSLVFTAPHPDRITADVAIEMMSECFGSLKYYTWLPQQTVDFFRAWINDVTEATR